MNYHTVYRAETENGTGCFHFAVGDSQMPSPYKDKFISGIVFKAHHHHFGMKVSCIKKWLRNYDIELIKIHKINLSRYLVPSDTIGIYKNQVTFEKDKAVLAGRIGPEKLAQYINQ